jgi:wyosine [tRNA(Phe)-imidazoG37] synthetase (radical SAM superfamily)
MSTSIFGPVLSRRFGLSLGVDLVGEGAKKCNYDCLYCELPKGEKVSTIDNPKAPELIALEVKEALAKNPDIDFITLTANGEPTLYPKLYELALMLNEIKANKKLLILSNGSTICDAEIRKSLRLFDVVKLSLDSALDTSFKKIDRPLETSPKKLIGCMESFRDEYGGTLVLESLFVKGVNDSKEDVVALNEAYLRIKPDRIDLSTIDRPPAYRVEAVLPERLREIAAMLDKSLMVSIATRKSESSKVRSFSKEEIIYSLKNRPFSVFDIEALFDEPSKKVFEEMKKEGLIKEREVAGTTFYWCF